LPRHRIHAAALTALLVAGLAAPAMAETRRVGIVVTTRVNVSEDQARDLAGALADAVHERLHVDVIAGADVERRLPPEGVPMRCVVEDACRQDLGRRLDADELLLLVMIGAGETVQIDATWSDVASGEVKSRPSIEVGPAAGVHTVLARAVPELLPHLVQRSSPPHDDARVVVVVPPARPGRRVTPATLAAAGVGAGALIGSVVFSLSSRRKFDTLDRDGCRSMPCRDQDIDSLYRDTVIADALFGVAVIAVGAAVWFYVASDSDRQAQAEPPPLSMTPLPGGVGLSLGGVF
jgi:hypothetical protein